MIESTKFNRFKDAPWFSTDKIYVIVGGAGGISSWLTLFLTRANFKPVVFDFDTIEEHNLGGQFYRRSDVGSLKVQALNTLMKEFADESIQIIAERYRQQSMAHHIMFSGFDNMKARRDMFTAWKDYVNNIYEGPAEESIFIDGRLLAEQMQIFCIRGNDAAAIEKYESEHLFTDEEVEDASCTFRQTTHAAAMIAAFMTGFFTNHVSNYREKNTARRVPFSFEYFIPLNMFTDD